MPVRKAGKLPGKTIVASFEKEYGTVSLVLFLNRAYTPTLSHLFLPGYAFTSYHRTLLSSKKAP